MISLFHLVDVAAERGRIHVFPIHAGGDVAFCGLVRERPSYGVERMRIERANREAEAAGGWPPLPDLPVCARCGLGSRESNATAYEACPCRSCVERTQGAAA